MVAGRHHSVPLPPAAGSAKVRFTLTSSSPASSSSVYRRKRAGGDGRGGGGSEKDKGDSGGRGGGGGDGNGGRGDGKLYGPTEREWERSRTDGSSIRDTVRDSSSNNSYHHQGARDLGRDGIGRGGGKDLGRESARDSGRELGRESGRYAARDLGREHRLRNFVRDEIARDSSWEGGGGREYGKGKDRSDRIRDWEQVERGREKAGRERERDKKERDLSSLRHQQQHQRRYSGGECGEKDRAASPSVYSRPPLSAVSGPAVLSTACNSSPPPAGDFGPDREVSGTGEARSSGVMLKEKDVGREPGELPSWQKLVEIGWRTDPSHSMSLHSRSARRPQPLEPDDGTKRSPPKKRKFSPIVWDYDEKHPRPSIVSSVSGACSASPASKIGSGAAPPPSQQLPVQPSAAVQSGPSFPLSSGSISPPSKPPSTGQSSSSSSRGAHEVQQNPPSPQDLTSSPGVERIPSPLVKEGSNETNALNIQMKDHVMASSMSDDEPEPGQLLPEADHRTGANSRMESPIDAEDDEDNAPPSITIARSRWAGEANTPGREKSPRASGGGKTKKWSSSLESEEGRASSGQDRGRLTSGPSTSPEPGEYIQEKLETPWDKERSNESDGTVAHGSNSKDRRSNSLEDEEYERELNKRELMELEEDDSDEDEEEEQRPYVESEFEGGPVIHSGPLSRAIDMLQGCRSVDEFERLNKIDEGTYGVVYRARDKKTGEIVALKKVKMEKEKEGFPMTSLREINVLLSFHHPSVVDVKEVVVGSSIDSIYMVMEYMEHDLKGLMETMKQPFSQSEVKCLMLQLFEGVKYLHDNWVLHRDLKTSNLLLNNRGELKICDFGLARQYGDPLKAYTHMVVTLWYRAPELLLGSKTYQYSTAIDMWSLGCIMAEFLAKEPLFNGKSEIDQIDKIFKTLGTPSEKIWPEFVTLPGVKCNFVRQPYNRLRERFPPVAFAGRPTLSERGFDLLNRLLTYDPRKRITADEALKHDWFREVPLPKSKEFMPTFPARSEHDRRVRRLMKSPDPLEEQRKRELRQSELGGGGLFG